MNSTTTINSMPNLTELFSGNMFTFDDVNSPVFQQHMEMMANYQHQFLQQQQQQESQQEVLLSSIMDDDATDMMDLNSAAATSATTTTTTTTTANKRDWRIINASQDLQHLIHDDAVKIAIKTRDDKAAHFQVPDKLYSSLRYVLSQKLDSELLQNKQTVLMSKIQVVNPQTHEEIRKKNNEYVIDKGNTMVELKYNPDSKCYECTEKIKFLDNSYRHNDIKFAFKVSFYDASQPAFLTRSPIVELLSAPFHVRARRPPKAKRDDEDVATPVTTTAGKKKVKKSTTTTAAAKKRKAEELAESTDDEEIEQIKKKPKTSTTTTTTTTTTSTSPAAKKQQATDVPAVTATTSNASSFANSKRIMNLLDQLAFAISALPEQERPEAIEAARSRLLPIEALRQPVPVECLPTEISRALNPSTDVDLATYTGDDLLSFEKFL